ncbi:nuclease-related domain-containing protein [Neobacillus mesonae]|uniref:nuclease-related domain-containing protein n=1 Tax=Neobacillus mesonae TaxID=1193713 RepID=UPI000830F40C|nr:nuclease-related domain-containing protein [Neobacillus mesonae]
MFFKHRTESDTIKILRSLNRRTILNETDKQHLLNLQKGFEGEVMFDTLIEKLQCESLILNDLLLKSNNSTFQIVSFMIKEITYLFEIKNYEGDFYYESDNFYTMNGSKIQNPLHQLNRAESLVSQLLHKNGYNNPIESWVVFINPAFTLYQAPKNQPIIYPTQLDYLLKKLSTSSRNLNSRAFDIAKLLSSLHQTDNPYTDLPKYNYEQSKKGFTCKACLSFSIGVNGRKIFCYDCGSEEDIESAVIRSVRELILLFPDKKITTNVVQEWCQVITSQIRITRILKRHFKAIGYGQWTYYV